MRVFYSLRRAGKKTAAKGLAVWLTNHITILIPCPAHELHIALLNLSSIALGSLDHLYSPPVTLYPQSNPTTTLELSNNHHVRTQSPHKILPPRLRPLQNHPHTHRSQTPRPQNPNRPPHGPLQHEMHLLRRIHLQRPKIQRPERNHRRKIPRHRYLPLLHPLHALLR